ncbi:MAG: CdvA-like protein [Candidatus Bathyarchaeia archaeon]
MSSRSLVSNLLLSSAKDMYGRFVGQVVGISYDTMGDVTAIQVEHGGGSLAEYPITQVSINKNFVVLIPKWKVETNIIQKEWNMIQKKIFALDNLLKSGKLSKEVHESLLKQEFEPAIKRLRKKREALLRDLKSRYDELKFQIKKFEHSIANIELERMVGGMDDQTYKTACDSIKPLLESAVSEKKDIEAVLEQLDKLDRAYR